MIQPLRFLAVLAALGLLLTGAPLEAADSFTFNMVVSAGANACLPNATAKAISTSTPAHTAAIVSIQIRGDLK